VEVPPNISRALYCWIVPGVGDGWGRRLGGRGAGLDRGGTLFSEKSLLEELRENFLRTPGGECSSGCNEIQRH